MASELFLFDYSETEDVETGQIVKTGTYAEGQLLVQGEDLSGNISLGSLSMAIDSGYVKIDNDSGPVEFLLVLDQPDQTDNNNGQFYWFREDLSDNLSFSSQGFYFQGSYFNLNFDLSNKIQEAGIYWEPSL